MTNKSEAASSTQPEWVNCPICGDPDMQKVPEGEEFLISCVNTACASNGGTNTSALSIQRELDSAHRLWEKEHDELVILREESKRWAASRTVEQPREPEGVIGWRVYMTAASGATVSEILYASSCVSALLSAARDLLEWMPVYSKGSSGYGRTERLKAEVAKFGKGGSLNQAAGVAADREHPAKSDTGGEIAKPQWADCPRCRQKVLAPHECYESVLNEGEREELSAEKYWKRYFEWKEFARMDDTDTHYSPGEVCRFAEAYVAYRAGSSSRKAK